MPKPYRPEDLDAIFVEIKGGSARATITVVGALLEQVLEKAIQTVLRNPVTPEEGGVLFSEMGILGNFYQKIWAAWACPGFVECCELAFSPCEATA